jgi:chromosome segregation ATPase
MYEYVEEQRQVIENYEKELKTLRDNESSLNIIKVQLNDYKDKCNNYERVIKEYENQFEEYKKQVSTSRTKSGELQENVEEEAANVQQEIYLNDFQDIIDKAEQENRLLKFQQENMLKKEILELNNTVTKLDSEIVNLKSEKEKSEVEHKALKEIVVVSKEHNKELKKSLIDLKSELNIERQKNIALTDNIRLMEEVVNATKGELEIVMKRRENINFKQLAELQKDRDILAVKSELNKAKVCLL